MEHQLWLIVLGVVLGALGTLIGVGGGFILVPILLLLYPHESPEIITAVSLAVVFANAVSGSWAYARMGRIDYKSGLRFAAATVPGAILGALTTDYIPRQQFNLIFGFLMVGVALYLFFNRSGEGKALDEKSAGHVTRHITEATGQVHTFSYNSTVGMVLSLFVGYVSSLLGIGGGIIHVPILVRLLNFPVHIATATSHFILAIMALTGTIVHISKGSFSHDSVYQTLYLSVGVLFGAQVGAALSARVHGRWIIRSLAIALVFVGIRILKMALYP